MPCAKPYVRLFLKDPYNQPCENSKGWECQHLTSKEIKPQFFKYLAPAVTGPQATEGEWEPDLCGYGVHSLNHYGTQSSKKRTGGEQIKFTFLKRELWKSKND